MSNDVTDNSNVASSPRVPASFADIAMPTALFGLFTFVLMSGGVLGDTVLSGVELDELAYNLREGLKLAGFLLYGAISWRRPRALLGRAATGLLVALAVLFSCSAVALHVMPSDAALVFAVMAMACVTGFAGGIVYETVAWLAVRGSDRDSAASEGKSAPASRDAATRTLGVVVGVGGALAVIAHYLLQLQVSLGGWFTALLVASFCLLMYMLDGALKERDEAFGATARTLADSVPRKQVLFLVGVVIGLFALFPFYETALRSSSSWIMFYQWQRLFLVVGYLAVGAAAFFGGRSVMSLVIAVVTLFTAFVVAQAALLQVDGFTMALFYVLGGAVVAYSAIAFMAVAPRTAHPAIVASGSRIADGAVTIAGGGLATLMGGWAVSAVLLAALALIALTLVLMVLGGFFTARTDLVSGVEPSQENSGPSTEERLYMLARECGLTDRERDVLADLVLTEKKNQQIADDLGISRRQVQTHIANIYAKTGTQTRAGLVMRIGAP